MLCPQPSLAWGESSRAPLGHAHTPGAKGRARASGACPLPQQGCSEGAQQRTAGGDLLLCPPGRRPLGWPCWPLLRHQRCCPDQDLPASPQAATCLSLRMLCCQHSGWSIQSDSQHWGSSSQFSSEHWERSLCSGSQHWGCSAQPSSSCSGCSAQSSSAR